jgi:hypothetical protein
MLLMSLVMTLKDVREPTFREPSPATRREDQGISAAALAGS